MREREREQRARVQTNNSASDCRARRGGPGGGAIGRAYWSRAAPGFIQRAARHRRRTHGLWSLLISDPLFRAASSDQQSVTVQARNRRHSKSALAWGLQPQLAMVLYRKMNRQIQHSRTLQLVCRAGYVSAGEHPLTTIKHVHFRTLKVAPTVIFSQCITVLF